MVLKNNSFSDLFNKIEDDSLYCYGIGDFFNRTIENFSNCPWDKKLAGLIDADANKTGTKRYVQGKEVEIFSIESFIKAKPQNAHIIITTKAYYDVVQKLNKIKELDDVECYIYFFMCNMCDEKIDFCKGDKFKIPPVIHYCWFGRKDMPDLYKRCIDSWHIHCPDYEIKEWNESNCDLDENLYSRQAYSVKKYGFVPDYFRLKIIFENGGIYLDTDVEIIKNLDPLRYDEGFCGLQYPAQADFGLGFGAVKGNRIIRKLMETYEGLEFIEKDGKYNEKASPSYQTYDLERLGMKKCNRKQYIDDFCIYPTWVLSPINIYVNSMQITEDTYTIHYYEGSWVGAERKNKKNEELRKAKAIAKMFK